MTEQDLEQVREALTDAVLNDAIDAWWDAGALNPMRDRLLAALAPLVRPAPTCATCQHYQNKAYELTASGFKYRDFCRLWHSPIHREASTISCTMHTPRPPTPERSAQR